MSQAFPDWFKRLLKRYKVTYEQIGSKLGIDKSTVSRYVRGELEFREDELIKTCRLCEFTESLTQEVLASYKEFWREKRGNETNISGNETPLSKIPLQRPPGVPYFTGREKQIEQILEDLKRGRVVTLVGPGGIGKSAIAAEIVWRLAPEDKPPEQFPDGIIYYNFYKQSRSVLALEHIVRSLHEEPTPSAEAAAKRALSGRRVLLLLEGTENADDLQEILAVRDNCGVLITSRSRKDVVDVRNNILTLSNAQAVSLLQAWGGVRISNDIIAGQICNLVGGLPLAICLAGRYMAEREEDAADYLVWLQETPLTALDHGQRQHESIPLLLQCSLSQVSEAAQQTLAVIGLLNPFHISHELIATTFHVSVSEASRILGELVKYNLLMRPEYHYQVTHILVHTYANKHISVSDSMLEELVLYYSNILFNIPDKNDIKNKLWSELENIVSISAECSKREKQDPVKSLLNNLIARTDDEDFKDYYFSGIMALTMLHGSNEFNTLRSQYSPKEWSSFITNFSKLFRAYVLLKLSLLQIGDDELGLDPDNDEIYREPLKVLMRLLGDPDDLMALSYPPGWSPF